MTLMNCNEAQPLVWSYIDGELSEAQAQPLRKHLLECHACRNSAQDGKSLKRWFVRAADAEAVPSGFASRVARAAFAAQHAERERELDEVVEPASFEERRTYPFVLRMTALAAGLLFVLSIAIRFQALPSGDGLRADTRQQLDDAQVRKLLDQINAADVNATNPKATDRREKH